VHECRQALKALGIIGWSLARIDNGAPPGQGAPRRQRSKDMMIADSFDETGEQEAELRPFVIDAGHHGQRVDRALAALAPEFSRSYLQQLIEAGAVTLGSAVVTRPSHKVKAGEEGRIELRPTPQSQAFRPEPIALRVVFEDAHLRVIDKPAGLVVRRFAAAARGHRASARQGHQRADGGGAYAHGDGCTG
jgi:hypothetical protein